jgi:ABC-type transporter Mla MlaB component
MTLKIEPFSERGGIRIRLSGELRSEHLDQVRAEMMRTDRATALDLDEVDLVDIHAVRFLNDCEVQGVEVVNCSPYIREWMIQERGQKTNSERT